MKFLGNKYLQYSRVNEGPHGTICTAWAHNMTDNTPVVRKLVVKKKRILKKPVIPKVKLEEPVKKSMHDLVRFLVCKVI